MAKKLHSKEEEYEEEKEKELDKEASQPSLAKTMTSAICQTDEEEEEYEEDEERRLSHDRMELELLGGALAPPPLFTNIHPEQQQELLTSFTKDGGECIDHNLVASRAVHELSLLAQDSGFFWTTDGMLNQQHYHQSFPRPNPTPAPTNSWTHSSRASAVVNMELTRLVKMLTTEIQWVKLFPSIVFKVTTLRFVLRGSSSRNPDGSLQLVLLYTRLQATTPLLPKRTFAFLRACKQIDNLTWVVADVPIDRSRNVGLPSGCLIRGMADGFSQVIWVEHLEVEENYLDRNLIITPHLPYLLS